MHFSMITSYSWPETNQTLVSFPLVLLFSNISITLPLIFYNISNNISSFSLSYFFRFLILFFLLKVTLFIIFLPNIYFIFIIDHINKFFLSLLLNNLLLKLLGTIIVLFSGMEDYVNIFIEISMLNYF
jgi:hypothetical protein